MKAFITRNKSTIIDLFIVCVATTLSITVAMSYMPQLNELSGIVSIVIFSLVQFSIAGLGPVIVMTIRKEGFSEYGLHRNNILKSLALGVGYILAYLVFTLITEGSIDWMPFKQVNQTWIAFDMKFPLNAIGLLFIAMAWGFFEGYTLLFTSKKINRMFDITNPFLRPAPILIVIINLIVHSATGHVIDWTWISGAITTYVVVMIPELTENSWGSILIFFGLWNAL